MCYREFIARTRGNFLKMCLRIVEQIPPNHLIFVGVSQAALVPIKSTYNIFRWHMVSACPYPVSHSGNAHLRQFKKNKNDCDYIACLLRPPDNPRKPFACKCDFTQQNPSPLQ